MKPLDTIRVLDLSRVLAGPHCTMMLADMGADVIKIEQPHKGDDTRAWGPPFLNGESAYYLSINRNKRSVTVNLKEKEGKEIFYKLVKTADVIIENFRPGTAESLGVSYPRVRTLNENVVYCSISGFGQDGPYRSRPMYDLILQGMGGLMTMTGEEGRPPVRIGVAVTDIAAGMVAAYSILVALYARERTGKGQYIDVSMLDCQVSWLTYQAGNFFATGVSPKRMGSAHPSIVPYQAFHTKSGYINVAVGNEKIWHTFCSAIHREDLAENPKYKTNKERVENRDELIRTLEEIFSEKAAAEWLKILNEAGVPAGPVSTFDQIFSDPQVLHRGMVVEVSHPVAGVIKQLGIPAKLSDTPGSIDRHPPLLGEHTDEILKDLGYTEDYIETLREYSVI